MRECDHDLDLSICLIVVESWERKERVMVSSWPAHLWCAIDIMNFSSTAIEHLDVNSHERGIPLLYYYFNFREPSTQTCDNFLQSILSQLICCLPEVPSAVIELYKRRKSGAHRPSVKDLTACFIASVETLKEVRLFSDAFDECSEWNALWHLLSKLSQRKIPSLHFLFTSRPEQHIREAVRSLGIPSIDLSSKENRSDIALFVSETLETDPRYACISVEGKNVVENTLLDGANGM
jgi:hypothetical protein